MTTELLVRLAGRREMLRNAATFAAGLCWRSFFRARFAVVLRRLLRSRRRLRRLIRWRRTCAGWRDADSDAEAGEGLTLLSGPGGNVVVLTGRTARSWWILFFAGLAEVEGDAGWVGERSGENRY